MSSLVLDTQSCATSGPVISVSSAIGGVTNEMPLAGGWPCAPPVAS